MRIICWITVACKDLWRGRDEMALQGHNLELGRGGLEVYGFGPPRLGVGNMAKISPFSLLFLYIMILCHVGFSVLKVV